MIAVNEQGVAALNSMASSVEEGVQGINSACSSVLNEVQGKSNLGPHKDSICSVVQAIQEQVEGATGPASIVAEKLKAKAEEYQAFIDNNRFSGKGN